MKKLSFWIAFAVIGTVGTLLHFCFDWSGKNPVVAVFSAINESTWEHLKLLFFPAALYIAVENLLRGRLLSGAPAAAAGIFSGMASIVIIFYTYSGVLGKNVNWIDILIFFIGVFITLMINDIFSRNKKTSRTAEIISALLLVATAVFFGIWTFYPPSLGIFISPV